MCPSVTDDRSPSERDPPHRLAAPSSSTPPQRRLLTVLFCDLVGSTELAARLDPEDLRDILAAYQRRATDIVERHGGVVARYVGDGVLAYFGFPIANEDDAERAARAGLELAAGIAVPARVGKKLDVRVGIATGIVVVGDLLQSTVADNPPITGQPPSLAARLQSLVAPGGVAIAADTRRLIGRLFECRDLGAHPFKGFDRPVQTWQIVGPTDIASRFDALRTNLPLVGRTSELALLLDLWQQAKAGSGRVAIVRGEPGIGKSRLTLELLSRVDREFPLIRRYDCSPHGKDSMLHPLLAQLQRASMFDRGDTPETKVDKLEALLVHGGRPANQIVAILADAMGLRVSGLERSRLNGHRRRALLFEALLLGLEQMARQRPVLIVIEDIQWIDATSEELLARCVDRIRNLAVLVVVTSRPGARIGWIGKPHVTTVDLVPIANGNAVRLVECIAGSEKLPRPIVDGIVARTDGVPLFIEEVTKAVVESKNVAKREAGRHSATPDDLGIPPSLHASLLARLDRLGPARQVASIAAAIGREFTFDLLAAVAPAQSSEELRSGLQQLVDAELIVPIGPAPASSFSFRHALIQDTAYEMSLRRERKGLHDRIATALLEHFKDTAVMQPEIIAYHFAKAGRIEPALDYWRQAGTRAAERGAFAESVKHLSEAIALTQLLPATLERSRTEQSLQIALGQAMMATHGYSAPECLHVFIRARDLAAEVGSVAEHMEVLHGLYNIHYGRAELDAAMATARQYVRLAEGQAWGSDGAGVLVAQTHFVRGEFTEARDLFRRTLRVYAELPERQGSLGVFGSQEVVAWAMIAGAHFALGEPDLARAATARSIERARALRHHMSIALALVTELLTPLPGGLEPDLQRADEAIGFCRDHGLRNFEVWARFAKGATVARLGDPRQGIAIMREAIDDAEAMHSRLYRPTQLATVGAAHGRLGEFDQALLVLADAIATAERSGQRQVLAGIHRAYGEVLFAAGKPADGERELTRAIEIATEQQARAELERIQRSLARLVGASPQGRRTRPLTRLRTFLRL